MLYYHSNLKQSEQVLIKLVGLDKWEFNPTPNEGVSPKRIHSSRSFARSEVSCGEIPLDELDKFKGVLQDVIAKAISKKDITTVTHPKTPGFIHSQVSDALHSY
jgi:hypothetical protein